MRVLFLFIFWREKYLKTENMDYYDIKRLALVLAVQAEIEGYKSANEERRQMNHSMAHPESDFEEKAMELRNLAHALNEQL